MDRQWQLVAAVRDETHQVRVLVKASESVIEGLTVIAVDEQEAVLVNVMGSITPELFTPALFTAGMHALGVDAPQVSI